MHEIDGADGGGQVVRTAVSMATVTGEAVRIENVRGDRPTGGMRPQHLAAVEAAAALCDADVEGDEAGSETLVFEPGPVGGGEVAVDIGTAGSIPLVFDSVLPLAASLETPASVTVTGGTDVAWSPPMAYLRGVKLPLLAAAGLEAEVSVARPGFYPVGGGEATLSLSPSSLSGFALSERGSLRRLEVSSLASSDLADADVAERQAAAAAEGADADAPVLTEATYAETDCPGTSLVVAAVYEGSRAGFSAIGEAGVPSEDVAAAAVDDFQEFHGGSAAVDRHLADQSMVWLALAGGEVLAPAVTDHVETNRAVLARFGHDLSVEEHEAGVLLSG